MSKVIVANWKMLVNGKQAKNLAQDLAPIFKKLKRDEEVVLCPSYPYLGDVLGCISKHKNVSLGAQNCAAYEVGAFTGEVSASMLCEVGVKYVIIGHSERRGHFKESTRQIKQKIAVAQSQKLHVILCIGETYAEYKTRGSENFIEKQLKQNLPKQLDSSLLTIAYEPVWAIGSGKTPTFDEIQKISMHIKNCTSNKFRIIYGGSVSRQVSAELKNIKSLDGLLVGGASTKAVEFVSIIKNYFGID